MSKITIKALKIIASMENVSARGFAEKMWPGANMHIKVSNQGHGATRGKAAWLCGGSYLGKLSKMGLIRHSVYLESYKLTKEGELLIK